MARSDRFMSKRNCPECGHPHRSDHPHFRRFKLDQDESLRSHNVSPAAPQTGTDSSTVPTDYPEGPSPSPVGAERGELPAQAAEALRRGKKERKPRMTAADKEAEEAARAALLNRCQAAVRAQANMLAWTLQDRRYRDYMTDQDRIELAEALAAFFVAWELDPSGKWGTTIMLPFAYAGVLLRIKEQMDKEDKGKEKETVQ